MTQYINKSALVAELNRLIAELMKEGEDTMFEQGRISAFEDVKVFINHTLEVKEVQEPTAADRGTAEEIIINLKRVEQNYHIDLTREMEWLRSKVKKEE